MMTGISILLWETEVQLGVEMDLSICIQMMDQKVLQDLP